MKEKLSNNLKLKIFAILFAAGLWMISININDPYQSKDYSVVVQLQNMNILTSDGKYVEVVGDSDEINVHVRGNRSVMESFTVSNIVATADLREMDEETFRVPIKLSTVKTTGNKIESIRADEDFLTVKVENVLRIQKNIEVEAKNAPAEGYILGQTTTEQNALRISGPESVVNRVDKAVVSFDLEGARDDVSMLLPIELYDAEGERIVDSRLTTSISQVQCVATILATKEVPISFQVKGSEARGYGFTGEIVVEPASILLAGKSSVLRNVNEVTVKDALDLTGARENVTVRVNIKDYLPDNTTLGDTSFQGEVQAEATVEKEVLLEKVFLPDEITVLNLPEGYEASVEAEEEGITVEFVGFQSVMEGLDEENIKLSVDMALYMEENHITRLEEGAVKVPLTYEVPEGLFVQDGQSVNIEIIQK